MTQLSELIFKRNKNNKHPLIRQIIDLVPAHILQGCIQQHQSDKGCSRYRTYDQFVAQAFGQLNKCYTLEDISAGIALNKTFIADLGLTPKPCPFYDERWQQKTKLQSL